MPQITLNEQEQKLYQELHDMVTSRNIYEHELYIIKTKTQSGEIDLVKVINTLDEQGLTLLFIAICQRKLNFAKFLMENGADTSVIQRNGTTLLHSMASMIALVDREGYSPPIPKWFDILNKLADKSDVNARCYAPDGGSYTPLDLLIKVRVKTTHWFWIGERENLGYLLEAARLLIAKGAKTNHYDGSQCADDLITPLLRNPSATCSEQQIREAFPGYKDKSELQEDSACCAYSSVCNP